MISQYLKEMTILFVDDEDGVRSSYETLLNMWSKKAYSASNGQEGLEVYKEYKPDIVVTDIKMPVMNGLEMIRRIKEINPESPTIITTAHQEPELLLDAVEQQVDGYIVKPIAKKELKKRLEIVAKTILFEREKQHQYDILETIIESSLEAILVFKGDKCIDVNKEALSIFGFNDKSELEDDKNCELLSNTLNFCKSEDVICDLNKPFEKTITNRNGKEVPVLMRCSELKIGEESLVIVAAVNLSAIKKLEEESKRKDNIMFQQSKMAAMGEMLGNIAHQWRQPLSVISTLASGMVVDKELGNLTDEKSVQTANQIVEQTTILSKTVEDFRNFFKSDKKKHQFDIKDIISRSLKFLEANFKTKGIDVIFSSENIEMYGLDNELIQALVNVINNARDALLENEDLEKRFIFIDVDKGEDSITIIVKDNAGGISEDIIDRIFEPYFTTKNQLYGTGIGLYMVQEIIVKHMNGEIKVKNVEFEYLSQKCKGAEFQMILPLKG